jgi:hypothetical protein
MSDQPMNDGTTNREDETLSHIMGRHARKNEIVARQLSREAMIQWQKAISGVLALPAAIAMGAAANTLFIAAFIERGFEALGATTEAMGRELDSQLRNRGRTGNGDWSGVNRDRT